jgi:hypothetical protein
MLRVRHGFPLMALDGGVNPVMAFPAFDPGWPHGHSWLYTTSAGDARGIRWSPPPTLPRLLKGTTSNAMTMETMSFFIPLPHLFRNVK